MYSPSHGVRHASRSYPSSRSASLILLNLVLCNQTARHHVDVWLWSRAAQKWSMMNWCVLPTASSHSRAPVRACVVACECCLWCRSAQSVNTPCGDVRLQVCAAPITSFGILTPPPRSTGSRLLLLLGSFASVFERFAVSLDTHVLQRLGVLGGLVVSLESSVVYFGS